MVNPKKVQSESAPRLPLLVSISPTCGFAFGHVQECGVYTPHPARKGLRYLYIKYNL